METAEVRSGTSVLHTLGAIPLALVTYILVSAIVTFLWFLFHNLLTVIRPTVLLFMAECTGAFVGIGAAKSLCEKWLPRASGKAVFVVFAVLCTGAIIL